MNLKALSLNVANPQFFKKMFFSRSRKQAFIEDVATLIADGTTPKQAIEYIAECSQGTTKQVAETILENISQGKSIADGMNGWFPNTIIELVRAGEEGGTLVQNLKIAANSLAQHNDTVNEILQAMTYPFVVLVLGLVVTVFINHSVLAQMKEVLPLMQWPSIGRKVVYFANFIEHWWWFLLLLPVILFFFTLRILQNYTGEGRARLDQLPIFSLYKKMLAANFLQTLGILVANGISLKKALKILQLKANAYLSWHLLQMEYRLGAGRDNIAEMLNTGLIEDSVLLRLKLVAYTHGFEHALIKQGEFAEKQLNLTIKRTAKISGHVLLGLSACLAIFLLFGLYTTGFALTGQ